jgi:hypothetical protein
LIKKTRKANLDKDNKQSNKITKATKELDILEENVGLEEGCGTNEYDKKL